MSLILYTVTVIDHVNNPNNTLANEPISIRTTQAGTPLATIYSDEDGLLPIAQPGAITNALGVFEFYAESPTDYDYTATVAGGTIKVGGLAHNKLSNRNAVGAHDAGAISRGASNVDADLTALELGQGAGVFGYATKALLDADLVPDDRSIAYVTNDPTATNNGTYRKSGATGTGSWVQSFDDLASQAYQRTFPPTTILDPVNTTEPVSGKSVAVHVDKQIGVSINDVPTYYKNIMNTISVNSNGYINSIGVIIPDVAWRYTNLIRVEADSTLEYSGTQVQSNVNQISFYDIDGVFISGVLGPGNGSVLVPSNAVFFRGCCLNAALVTSRMNASVLDSVAPIVASNRDRIEVLESDSLSAKKLYSNAFNSFTLILGYVNTSGVPVGVGTDNTWRHTNLIAVDATEDVSYSGTVTPTNVNQVSFYDESNLFISGVVGGTDGTVTPPANAKYVRICKKNSAVSAVASFTSLVKISSVINDKVNYSDIVDNLVSSATGLPLSANQGRILNEKLANFGGGLNYNYDVNHIIMYGQSLSQGDWQTTIISDTQPYNTLMFNGGIRTWESTDPSPKSSLVPAIERAISGSPDGAPVKGETPASGSADFLVELIEQEDSFNFADQQYQIMVSAPGFGGQSITALSKGGIYYTRLIEDVTQAKALSNAAGKTYWCPVVTWIQGETDMYNDITQQSYYDKMTTLFNDLNTDIRAITGQSEDVQILLYQTASHDFYFGEKYTYPYVALAQLQITRDLPNVHMATPIYHLPKLNDVVHLTSVGSKWFGGYFGVAYKRIIIDESLYSGMYVKNVEVIGNSIYVKFHAEVYPLKFDTVNVVDRGVSKGFQIRNVGDTAQNSFLDIITNVEINKYDTVKITCSSSPAGKVLTYSMNGTGSLNPSSGNLRDSQDLVFNFKDVIGAGSTTPHNMYNWCPIFTEAL